MFQNVLSSELDDLFTSACYDAGMNTKDTPTLLVTEEQKAQLFKDGFVRLDNVIDQAELNWYRERYDSLFSDESKIKQLGGKDSSGRATLPQILEPSRMMPEFRDRPYLKRLHEIATTLLGSSAKFVFDHMILKPAGYGIATPWHQDQAYHNPNYRYTNINFWLPLEDVDVEGGCMHYVRYTHGGTIVPHRHLIPGVSTSALVADNQDYWMANATALPCPAGSVCLHLSYSMHYAAPNTSSRQRRAYIAIFQVDSEPLEHPFHLPWRSNPYWPDSAPGASAAK